MDMVLLGAIRRGSEEALGKVIDKYNAYVCTVIRNAVGNKLSHEDIEETSEDVFLALWDHVDNIRKLKSWLAATARHKSMNKLRAIRDDLPLDDEIQFGSVEEIEDSIEDSLIAGDERAAVKAAILAMDAPDREIFLRHYYGSQTIAAIAAESGMTEAAIKHRLVRGREKLRLNLNKEVFGE
ncbi:MAG: sigma-70 family RNA polymerase sigma factor [Oscillospiraceae bacterium]|nr:sigma-70 family RNA polymerase sigma factor [Oscillospiraceae bacterium]